MNTTTVYHLYDQQHLTGRVIREINEDQVLVAWEPDNQRCIEWKDELRTTPTRTGTRGAAA